MSYEGYVQNLCEEGHLTTSDAYEDLPVFCQNKREGKTCGKRMVWSFDVDCTNGHPYTSPHTTWKETRECEQMTGLAVVPRLMVKNFSEYRTCGNCGCCQTWNDTTYVIPEDYGRREVNATN